MTPIGRRLSLLPFSLLLVAACDEVPVEDSPAEQPITCEAAGAGVQWLGAAEHPGDGCPFERFCGVDEYVALPDLAPDLRLAFSDEEVDGEMLELLGGNMPGYWEMDSGELASVIMDGTRVDVLLEGITERPLEVRVLSEGTDYAAFGDHWDGSQPDMPYKQLLVTDPLVGTFEVGIFYPPASMGDGPFPAIVAAHGHNDNAWIHTARDGFGEEFTSAGYVLVVPSFRANDGEMPEHTVSRELLKAGWSMMAVRIYETLLARRIAATLPEVDACEPVGLIGHSGGSISSALTIRLAKAPLAFGAYINDLESTYINWDMIDGWTLDETAPRLFPYQFVINRFETLSMPSMRAGYGYPEGIASLVDFFDDSL